MLKLWQRGASETLCKKFGKEMRRVMFTNPTTGKEEEFYLFGQRDWSEVMAITDDGKVIVVRQFKQGCDKFIDELPAGTPTFEGENPEDVAKREFLEETGYQTAETVLLGPPIWMATRNSWTRFHLFLAMGCKKVAEAKLDASEEIEVELIPYKDWLQQCQTQIENGPAIIAAFRSQPHCKHLMQ